VLLPLLSALIRPLVFSTVSYLKLKSMPTYGPFIPTLGFLRHFVTRSLYHIPSAEQLNQWKSLMLFFLNLLVLSI